QSFQSAARYAANRLFNHRGNEYSGTPIARRSAARDRTNKITLMCHPTTLTARFGPLMLPIRFSLSVIPADSKDRMGMVAGQAATNLADPSLEIYVVGG